VSDLVNALSYANRSGNVLDVIAHSAVVNPPAACR
jgi:hypothetical protein